MSAFNASEIRNPFKASSDASVISPAGQAGLDEEGAECVAVQPEPRGQHELMGIDGRWDLHAASS